MTLSSILPVLTELVNSWVKFTKVSITSTERDITISVNSFSGFNGTLMYEALGIVKPFAELGAYVAYDKETDSIQLRIYA